MRASLAKRMRLPLVLVLVASAGGCSDGVEPDIPSLVGVWISTSKVIYVDGEPQDVSYDRQPGDRYAVSFAGDASGGTWSSFEVWLGVTFSRSGQWSVEAGTLLWNHGDLCTFTEPNGTTTFDCEGFQGRAVYEFRRE